jgi:DNA invertase Pin-like site-specific DNA recombinase
MYVVYYRSKRNLAGQKRAVKALDGEVIATYTEREPARRRSELEKAIRHALEAGATLVVAKVDRLVRNALFTGRLMRAVEESGLEFICCDNPTCNTRTIHILAAVAQEETQRKAQRTRQVMARLKEQGVPLGSARPGHWKGREHKRGWKKAVPAASKARSDKARREYQWLLPEIKARRERGDTIDEIARWLNEQGKATSAGKPFTEASLWRIIKRYLGDEYLGNAKRKANYKKVTAESREEVLSKVIPRIKELREEGVTFQEIATRLNEEGYRTPRGSEFSQSVVWNLTKKYLGQDHLGRVSEGALQA